MVGTVAIVTQLSNLRAEARRRQDDIDEARRAERLTQVINFLKLIQQGELIAVEKYDRGRSSESLDVRRDETKDAIWVAQRIIELLCERDISDAAHDLSDVTDRVMYHGSSRGSVVLEVRPVRKKFIDLVNSRITSPGH